MVGSRRLLVAGALALALCASSVSLALADATHVVQPGENLYRIALRYGTTVTALVRANGLVSADRVAAGQRLVVPGTGSPSGSGGSGSSGGTTARRGPGAGQHVVQVGDTLYRIALRYGTTVSSLVRANGLASADRIFVGQNLVVPGADGSASPPDPAGAPSNAGGAAARRIVVDLSSQTLAAIENGVAVRSFVVSTGRAATPTPIGTFSVYARYAAQTMYGPGYYLPAVPYVQYFTGAYAIHGTYWHTSFGTPVSHGCVNLTAADAAWVWRWSGLGTTVTVQP